MLKYEIRERRIQLDPLSITIRNLNLIWEQDTSMLKEVAFKRLTYIHLCAQVDKDAPYFTANPVEIKSLVRNDLFGHYDITFAEEEELFLEECIQDYQKANEDPEIRALRVINNKIDQAQEMIDATDIRIVESNVKGEIRFNSNFKIINDIINNITKWTKVKEELSASIEKAKARGSVIRGGKKLSYLERMFRNKRITNELPEGIEQTINIDNISSL